MSSALAALADARAMKRVIAPVRKSERSTSDRPEMVISTSAVDLENDRLRPEGVQVSKNVPVLWLHDAQGFTPAAGIPIGVTLGVTVKAGRELRATWRWLEGDPFVDRIRNAWDQGIINAASVGFIPIEQYSNEYGGYDVLKWRLLEWSLVPIGANPEAIRQLKALRRPPERLRALPAEQIARIRHALRQLRASAEIHEIERTVAYTPSQALLRQRQLQARAICPREDLKRAQDGRYYCAACGWGRPPEVF